MSIFFLLTGCPGSPVLFTLSIGHQRCHQQSDNKTNDQSDGYPFYDLPEHNRHNQRRNDGHIPSSMHSSLKPSFLVQCNDIGQQSVSPRHAGRQLPEEHQTGIDKDTLAIPGYHQATFLFLFTGIVH